MHVVLIFGIKSLKWLTSLKIPTFQPSILIIILVPQQAVTYSHQQPAAPTYVYPTANVGYTPAPTHPGPPIPGAVGGYPYQQPVAHVPPPQPPPPGSYPQQQPGASYPPSGQMPAYSYDTQYTQKQSFAEPSAPPPSYEEAQQYTK